MSQNEDSLSIYKRFLQASTIRIILGRISTLGYIYIISRLVSDELYDFVVFLAGVNLTLVIISNFGLNFASIRYSKFRDQLKEHALALPVQLSILVGIPLLIGFWELFLGILFKFNLAGRLIILKGDLSTRLFFDLSVGIGIITQGIKNRLDAGLRSDDVARINLINSVGQSIVIPIFFFFLNTLQSFFIAWSVVGIFPLLIYKNEIINSFKFKLDMSIVSDILIFGSPIMVYTIINKLGSYAARYIIFFEFPEGSTTLYHWILRFNELTLTALIIATVGLFPILLQHTKQRELKLLQKDNDSYFRITSSVAQISFGVLVLLSRIILSIVLPPEYLEGITLFYIISLGMLIHAQGAFLNPHLQAFGRRRWILVVNLIKSFLEILISFLLAPYGLTAIGWSILIVHSIRLMFLLSISKSLKFESYRKILYPIIISIITFSFAVFVVSIFKNIWINGLFAIIYPLFVYGFLRLTKIIQLREIDLVLRVLPKGLSKVMRKILI